MNNLGFSNDNLHIGNVRIKGQNETIIIGNENGGDGYILPTEKGTEGQVITMNADNSTSFQDAGASQTARIIVNKFTALTTNNNNDFGNFRVIENTSVGTKNFSSTEWTVNSEIRIKVVGYWNYQRADFPIFPTGIFGIRVGDANFPPIAPIELYNVQATNDYTGPTFPQTVDNEGYFNLDVSLVKLNNNQYSLRANLANSRQIINDFSYTGIITPDKLNNHPVTLGGAAVDPFFCQIEWQDNTSQSSGLSYLRPSINIYEIDLVNSEGAIIGTQTAPTTDHNTLANLTVGDVHTQYTKLTGRAGGQILSGGLTPLHNLTLKSHDIGLPNIIVKDLNTTFEKDIDMAQRLIQNCSGVINPTATTGIAGTSSSIGESTTNMSMIFQSNQASIQQLANQIIRFEPSVITSSKNIDMNQNQIDNCLVINNQAGQPLNLIGGSNVSAVILDATPTQGVIIGSNVGASTDITGDTSLSLRCNNGSIDLFPSTLMSVIIGGLPRFAVDSTQVNVGNDLIMNNNNINNANTITASNNLTLNAGNNSGIIIENAPNDTIIFQKSTNHNNNVLDNVGTGVITNIVNCQSINGITPVGGLYASTSAGILINNTTLTSLTPSSSVGSLSVPANIFNPGDCFHLVITGDCVFNNNDDVQITLKQNGNILAQTPVFSLEDANNGNNVFEIEADFNIRSIGAAGSIHTSFEFTYNKDSLDTRDFRGTRSNDTQTINTTIVSALDVEFQFISKDPSSSIQSQLFRLQKVF